MRMATKIKLKSKYIICTWISYIWKTSIFFRLTIYSNHGKDISKDENKIIDMYHKDENNFFRLIGGIQATFTYLKFRKSQNFHLTINFSLEISEYLMQLTNPGIQFQFSFWLLSSSCLPMVKVHQNPKIKKENYYWSYIIWLKNIYPNLWQKFKINMFFWCGTIQKCYQWQNFWFNKWFC